ncbi:hypothetical protein [Candidatus Electronema sp. TJ]|uniref:hypothetical protein n=1 Tax=Candidatus Electronema sp. TJ TaxID=3401573 RepID=UPI003AA83319
MPIILACFSALFFYYVNSNIEEFRNWPNLKYKSGDSTTYLDAGNWLIGKAEFHEVKQSVAIRPFFYPLIVALLEAAHPWAVLVYQFILWELQILIVYFCGILISRSAVTSFVLSLFCVSILSPIGISLHVLAETTSSFLLVISLFFLIYYATCGSSIFLFFYLFALSLCSVVKPLYFYIFIFNSLLGLFFWRKKNIVGTLLFLLIMVPISFQLYIMKNNFNINNISFVDTLAVNDYFLCRLELYKRRIEKEENSMKIIKTIRDARRNAIVKLIDRYGYRETGIVVSKEFNENMRTYPYDTLRLFIDLVIENSKQSSSFLPAKTYLREKRFFFISLWQSDFLRTINILSLLIFLSICFYFKSHAHRKYIIVNISLFFSVYATYIANGITFWQGDRFIIPIYFISAIWFFIQINTILDIISVYKK